MYWLSFFIKEKVKLDKSNESFYAKKKRKHFGKKKTVKKADPKAVKTTSEQIAQVEM